MEMAQNGYQLTIGIDVSKSNLDIAFGSQGSVEKIGNEAAAIKKMITALKDPDQTLFVVEATGDYESLLVEGSCSR